jgi:NAD(P)-dependent dehydrogenase (short-subunit alcohol dehydrogenase family)
MKDLFSLKGRTALVTGGSRGIGRMIAAGFLRTRCARVYISSRKAAACDAMAGSCRHSESVSPACGCVHRPGRQAAGQCLDGSKEPVLDILVNNAGAAWGEVRHLPRKRLGQGDGPEFEIALLPDAGAARSAQGRRPSHVRPR